MEPTDEPIVHRASDRVPAHVTALGAADAGTFANLKHDLPASLVVFLVALPLCLGIAVASGAPPLAGLLTGIIGGIIVSWASGSHLAVSGPAAGLTSIVTVAIAELSYDGFLLAVVAAGAMQILLGFARAGIFAYYFPSSVIKGMLAAIGIILILKQIPHALGFDADFEGDLTLFPEDGPGPVESLQLALEQVRPGAVAITLVGLAVLVGWSKVPRLAKLKWLPAPLLVVGLGVAMNALFAAVQPGWVLEPSHLVELPSGGFGELWREMSFPDFARWGDPAVYSTAFTIAAVASIETLLCVEAMDKLDPYKRSTPTNRELVAQGIGNMLSGAIGGLPMTAVIVRGSANIQSGGRTRIASFAHGLLLLVAVLALPWLINLIPLAALAAILLHVGYKLARIEVFRETFAQGFVIWAPFLTTVVAVQFLDLLEGVGIGMALGFFFILRDNLRMPYFMHHYESHEEHEHWNVRMELSENVSFLNKASVNKVLHQLPRGARVEIDGQKSRYIHPDVLELIHEFDETSPTRGIEVHLIGVPEMKHASSGH